MTDEQRKRIHDIVYSCDDRAELAERIVALEELVAENAKLRELVKDMVLNIGGCALHGNPLRLREFGSRAKELGVRLDG